MRRVFAIEVLTCDRCGGKGRLVAWIDKDASDLVGVICR